MGRETKIMSCQMQELKRNELHDNCQFATFTDM